MVLFSIPTSIGEEVGYVEYAVWVVAVSAFGREGLDVAEDSVLERVGCV